MKIPKLLQQAFYLYPLVQLLELAYAAYVGQIGLLLFVSYFQSIIIWRLLRKIYGQPVGQMRFGKQNQDGCLWYVLLQLQYIYISLPFFERLLMFVPGLYSFWLRLWGSKIGKKVMWTPEVTLYDRTHLDIGDRVLFGSRVLISCHVVNKRDRNYTVYLAPVKIGNDVFLGFETSIGPGVTMGDRSMTEVRSLVLPYTKIESEVRYGKS